MDGTPLLILDLETAPLPDAADYLDPVPPPDPPVAHRGLKDPVKIAADMDAKQLAYQAALAKWEQAKVEQVNACALNPDLAQIICVGMYVQGAGLITATGGENTEANLIRSVADFIGSATIVVGFNVRFDLGMLKRRALYLGVDFPNLSLDKYRAAHLIDLQDILSETGYWSIKGKSLDFYAKRFGLDVPDDPTGGGAEMPRLFAAGDWASIRRHCEIDILKTKALAQRLGVLHAPAVAEVF